MTKRFFNLAFFSVICCFALFAANNRIDSTAISQEGIYTQELFTQSGTDTNWKYITMKKLIPISTTSYTGITGSTIHVNHNHPQINSGPYSNRSIENNIGIHTLGNADIARADFSKWTRWYQEDGNTQVFRLFKDEHNVRNKRRPAPRVEAEAPDYVTGTNMNNSREWAEWSGTYTIVKPMKCCIFQIWGVNLYKPNGSGLIMIELSANGKVEYNPRDGGELQTMIENATGKSFHVRVKDYGDRFELYLNGNLFTSKMLARTNGSHFRWGMYASENVPNDAMIFVTGANVKYSN